MQQRQTIEVVELAHFGGVLFVGPGPDVDVAGLPQVEEYALSDGHICGFYDDFLGSGRLAADCSENR